MKRERDRVRERQGRGRGTGEEGEARHGRSGNSVKARSPVEAVPHSANSGNCSREISNMRASRLHTARNSIRGTDRPSTEHELWSPLLPCTTPQLSWPRRAARNGKIDPRHPLSLPLPAGGDLASIDETCGRRSLRRCTPLTRRAWHSVSVHLPAR